VRGSAVRNNEKEISAGLSLGSLRDVRLVETRVRACTQSRIINDTSAAAEGRAIDKFFHNASKTPPRRRSDILF